MAKNKVKWTADDIEFITQTLKSGKPLPDKYRFMIFDDEDREVELVWNGKTRDVCTTVLPFQVLEHVDEPRQETRVQQEMFDSCGRQIGDWTNKLIWGDNKLILSSLKSGALRQQIEDAGGLKLIYIDPPFDVGADFFMRTPIGKGDLGEPSTVEYSAYSDTWGRGADSFIAMLYERLILMRDLLSDDGSIYVHCDWRVNPLIRLAMDELFGRDRFINQIEWSYKTGGIPERVGFSKKHDHILFFSRSADPIFNQLYQKSYVRTLPEPHTDSGKRLGVMRDNICELCEAGYPGQKYRMVIARDVWDDIPSIFRNDEQGTGYATQKPEALLERIIKASSNEGDLIADFFAGSGTTAAVAEKLGRKWIAADLGKLAIHTTRKRMIGVQRELKDAGKSFRAFEVLTLENNTGAHKIGFNISILDQSTGGRGVRVQLSGFNPKYSEEDLEGIKKKRGQRVYCDDAGMLVRDTQDKHGVKHTEVMTSQWSDWVDYWSVDFDYDPDKGFRGTWRDFRGRKDRDLALTSDTHYICLEPDPDRIVAVLVVDILGNVSMDSRRIGTS